MTSLLDRFSKIAPVWAKRIRDEGLIWNAIKRYENEYINHSCCLVGEAHGFTDDYSEMSSPEYCKECASLCIVWAEEDSRKEQNTWLRAFIKHWNTRHKK